MLRESDDAEWFRMRDALWPGLPESQHRAEMLGYRSTPQWAVFVVDRGDGQLGGFLELGQRAFADGCTASPVPYIEAWYVDPDLRRSGVGRALIEAAERHARDNGSTEIASDCVLSNGVSRMAHCSLGYEEVHRSIHFRKPLTGG
jgi:aminoglycoside 6'-N-acetyltransferase I